MKMMHKNRNQNLSKKKRQSKKKAKENGQDKTPKKKAKTKKNQSEEKTDNEVNLGDISILSSLAANENNELADIDDDLLPDENASHQITMRDIIRNVNQGKPTKAAKERMENRKKKKKSQTVTAPAPQEKPINKEVENNSDITATQVIAPRVQFIDGKLVLDANSLVVHVAGASSVGQVYEQIIQDTQPHVTSASYSTRTPSEKWTTEETDIFYQALRQYGTDFSLFERLFPNRNRRQLKNKFKKEEKEHPQRIEYALNNGRLPLDLSNYKELENRPTSSNPPTPSAPLYINTLPSTSQSASSNTTHTNGSNGLSEKSEDPSKGT